MASHPETKIDCSKVYVKKSSFSNEETGDFDGAFAAVAIKEGQFIIEIFWFLLALDSWCCCRGLLRNRSFSQYCFYLTMKKICARDIPTYGFALD